MFSALSDEHFMKEALKEAHKAKEEGEVPVGAVVVCDYQIIARAYNQVEKLTFLKQSMKELIPLPVIR